jgi:hypothetical protein
MGEGLGRRAPRAPATAGQPTASDTRLDQLEQLGRLRENGLLDAAELEREKTRVMAEAPPA